MRANYDRACRKKALTNVWLPEKWNMIFFFSAIPLSRSNNIVVCFFCARLLFICCLQFHIRFVNVNVCECELAHRVTTRFVRRDNMTIPNEKCERYSRKQKRIKKKKQQNPYFVAIVGIRISTYNFI